MKPTGRVRLDSKETVANGWFGMPVGPMARGNTPVRQFDGSVALEAGMRADGTDDGAALSSYGSSHERAWWQRGVRFVRNAAIGLALLATIPFTVIGTHGDRLLRESASGTRTRLREVERLRPLMVPRDAGIAPMEAGRLLHQLNPTMERRGFPVQPALPTPARAWETPSLTDAMFQSLRKGANEATMASGIVTAAAHGFSADELEYLRAVAESPVWRDVERLASAPAVDAIGGRFVLPFRADAVAFDMPVMRFNDTKRLAYAGVSRAAYYVAVGQPAQAEAALKTVLSYGFVVLDNGAHLFDALIGRVIIGIAQDGLHQLYSLTGDARGFALTAPFARVGDPVTPTNGRADVVDAEAALARIVRDAQDPALPRTVRLTALHQLVMSSCSSIRGTLFGASPDVQAVFGRAADDLARFPSERAFLELMAGTVDRLSADHLGTDRNLSDRVIVGAATATAAVLGNPRVATCTRLVQANE